MTAAHYVNENVGRGQAINREENLEYIIVFPKYKNGSFIVRKIITNCK